VTTETLQQQLDRTRDRVHERCFACGVRNGHAPRVVFETRADGGVEAVFAPRADYEGYDGILHGGVIATLLDAAMTNCLFARGHCGVTADLHLRYRHPVVSTEPCQLHAWIERSSQPLFVLQAELVQAGQRRVTAVGKFLLRRHER
jgi:acyl-coenzyme A thioesterase PaaI-like protein